MTAHKIILNKCFKFHFESASFCLPCAKAHKVCEQVFVCFLFDCRMNFSRRLPSSFFVFMLCILDALTIRPVGEIVCMHFGEHVNFQANRAQTHNEYARKDTFMICLCLCSLKQLRHMLLLFVSLRFFCMFSFSLS